MISYLNWIIESNDLGNRMIRFTINQELYLLEVKELLQIINSKSKCQQEFIHSNLNETLLLKYDLMEFLEFIAKTYVIESADLDSFKVV